MNIGAMIYKTNMMITATTAAMLHFRIFALVSESNDPLAPYKIPENKNSKNARIGRMLVRMRQINFMKFNNCSSPSAAKTIPVNNTARKRIFRHLLKILLDM